MNAAREMRDFLDKIPNGNKKAFVFSTCGSKPSYSLSTMKKILESKGYSINGEHYTISYDVWTPLKLLGGINKGRPNKEDLSAAEEFGKSLKF
jgi:flavodoxin